MVGKLLLRGMLVGLVAAIISFAFAKVYGEPQVDAAIAFEEKMSQAEAAGGHDHSAVENQSQTPEQSQAASVDQGAAAHSHGDDEEIVSRGTQAGIGLATGLLVYGTAIGGIFALVFAYANGRLGNLGSRGTSAVLALLGFIAIIAMPMMKYPANPPAVGNPDTIGIRTEYFFIMILLSVLFMVLAVNLAKRLWPQFGAWNATFMAGLAYLVVMAIVKYALPDINEVPADFSANVLWQFRTASLGIHAILWTCIGFGFGALVERDFAVSHRGKASRAYA